MLLLVALARRSNRKGANILQGRSLHPCVTPSAESVRVNASTSLVRGHVRTQVRVPNATRHRLESARWGTARSNAGSPTSSRTFTTEWNRENIPPNASGFTLSRITRAILVGGFKSSGRVVDGNVDSVDPSCRAGPWVRIPPALSAHTFPGGTAGGVLYQRRGTFSLVTVTVLWIVGRVVEGDTLLTCRTQVPWVRIPDYLRCGRETRGLKLASYTLSPERTLP